MTVIQRAGLVTAAVVPLFGPVLGCDTKSERISRDWSASTKSPTSNDTHDVIDMNAIRVRLNELRVDACISDRRGDSDLNLTIDPSGEAAAHIIDSSYGHDAKCLERLIHFKVSRFSGAPVVFSIVVSARATGYGPPRYENKATVRLVVDAEDAGLKPPVLHMKKI